MTTNTNGLDKATGTRIINVTTVTQAPFRTTAKIQATMKNTMYKTINIPNQLSLFRYQGVVVVDIFY